MYAAAHPRESVYVVDDDFAIRDSLKALLEAYGFSPQVFSCGLAFLSICKGTERACVLLDVCLPDLDGLRVLAALREKGIDMPVVLITAHDERVEEVSIDKLGAFAVLKKPLNDGELLEVVTRALGGETDCCEPSVRRAAPRPDHADRAERGCRPSYS